MLGHAYRKLNSSEDAPSTSHSGSPVTPSKDGPSNAQVFCTFFIIIYSVLRFITLYTDVKVVM